MRKFIVITIAIITLMTFNSCATINYLLGVNDCAMKGCKNESTANSKYCPKHLDGIPDNFDKDMKASVDKQVKQYNDNLNKK